MNRRSFLKNLGVVIIGIIIAAIPICGNKVSAMLANRMMMGAAGVSGAIISNASLLDLACTAAELADGWTDGDTGEAVSQAETNAPAADPMATVWSFDTNTSADTNDQAIRSKDIGSIEGLGNRIVVSLKTYCDLVGTQTDSDEFTLVVRRSDWRFGIRFGSDGLFIADSITNYNEIGTDLVVQDTWQEWTFDVDLSGGVANATCDVYLDNVLVASGISCNKTETVTDGQIIIGQNGYTHDNQISYLDWLKIGNGFE